MAVDADITLDNLETLVEGYTPLLVRAVSRLTGRYVSLEHDDAFSVALEAFAEAVGKYDPERGSFPAFAELVVTSRLRTFLEREARQTNALSLEALQEEGLDFPAVESEDDARAELAEEIGRFRKELAYFGLTLERLADDAPKHRDTRRTALRVGETAAKDEPVVALTYKKRKLPVRETARVGGVTEKVVKGSKHFILSILVIFVKRLDGLIYWLEGTRCFHER